MSMFRVRAGVPSFVLLSRFQPATRGYIDLESAVCKVLWLEVSQGGSFVVTRGVPPGVLDESWLPGV
jgi:hypothetical protein